MSYAMSQNTYDLIERLRDAPMGRLESACLQHLRYPVYMTLSRGLTADPALVVLGSVREKIRHP